MDPLLIDAIGKIAAHNLTRDLASALGEPASDVSKRYIIEAYKSIQLGGEAYQSGVVGFASTLIEATINEFMASQATSA